jgi:hypothetical protein
LRAGLVLDKDAASAGEVIMSRKSSVLVAGVAIAGLLSIAPPAAATPAPLICGSVISKSATLKSDLACSGTAIEIDNVAGKMITLNLGGHTISGGGVVVVGSGGIVVVSNGTVTGVSGAAITGHGPVVLRLSRMVVSYSVFGVSPDADSTGFQVRNSQFDHDGTGIATDEVSAYLIADSTFTANGLAASLDISNGTFVRNSVVGNTNGVLSNDSLRQPITFENNLFAQNTGYGISYGQGAFGPPVPEITGNKFVNNGVGLLWDTDSYSPGIVTGSVTRNTFTGNAGDGAEIRVTAGSSVTVAHNTASSNGAYGIEAYNVIDGRHNRAGLNGNPAQCLGVLCTPVA